MPLPKATPEQLAAASNEELAEYAGPALERLQRGRLPPAVFMPIRELTRPSTLDVIGFHAGTHGERVLIGQRGAEPGDRWWAGRRNITGSLVLPTEEGLEPIELRMADGRPVDLNGARVSQDITTPADRILRVELQGSVQRVAPVRELMTYWVDVPDRKISEHKITSWTQVDLAPGHQEVIGGAFYDTERIINDPPENLVHGHAYFIERAALALQAIEREQ
ncbi:MAG TPA: hypothetical protein VLF43_00060 [Candidatus Saccharimonadales bacterium]|nr:hypothetical protein [Candidatus Saccharimonadales bacterium]